MTDVAKAVEAMKAKFNPAAADGLDLVFGFRIDDTQDFSLVVKTTPANCWKVKTQTPR